MLNKIFLKSIITVFLMGCSASSIGFPKEEILTNKVLNLTFVLKNQKSHKIGDFLLFRPDGKELISTVKHRSDYPLYIWDLEKQQLKKMIDKGTKRIKGYSKFIFSNDSKKLYFSSQYNDKPEFDVKTQQRVSLHVKHFGEINTSDYAKVIFYPYNKNILYEEEIINTVFGQQMHKKKILKTGAAVEVFFLKDEYLIADSYFENRTRGLVYFDKNNLQKYTFGLKKLPYIYKAAISPDKKYLAVTFRNSIKTKEYYFREGIAIYDLNLKKKVMDIENVYDNISIFDIQFLDNEHIIIGPTGFTKRGYRAKDGEFYTVEIKDIPIKVINIHTQKEQIYFQKDYRNVHFSQSIGTNYFISYSLSQSTLIVWDKISKQPVQTLKFGRLPLGMAVSSDKKQLAVSYKDSIYVYGINNVDTK